MGSNGNGNGGHSLAAYAKHRGVSVQAVSRAVARRRISARRNAAGQPRIADFAVADLEWAANTDSSRRPLDVREREAARGKPAPPSARALRPDGTGVVVPTPYDTTALEEVSVVVLSGPDGDQVAICVIQDPAGDDAQPVLVVDKNTAANLGLRLWTEMGGDVEDLPGVKRRAATSANR